MPMCPNYLQMLLDLSYQNSQQDWENTDEYTA